MGGFLCLLPPHSENQVPTVFIEVWGKGAEGGKDGLISAPRKPEAGLVGAERGKGKETRWAGMPAWTNRASGHPEDPSQAAWFLETSLPLGLPTAWSKGGESSWSGHPSSPSSSPLCCS